jgi:hypothetical protein
MEIDSRSRAALFVRAPSVSPSQSRKHRASIFVRAPRLWKGRKPSRSGTARKKDKERKRNAGRRAGLNRPIRTIQVRHHTIGHGVRRTSWMLPPKCASGALACRRSTTALARGTAGPQGSASGHASCDSAGAFGSTTPAPTGGRRPRAAPRALPAAGLSQSSGAPHAPVVMPAG